MKKINTHVMFIAAIFILSLFYLNSLLQKGVILDNIHYINDLTFLSQNVKESLKKNELALWTPYFYAGHPLLAIPESYMFDLNFLLIYLFGKVYLAMNLSLIFYFFLAGFGMYLLVHYILSDKKAAFISAIIYMFNGYMHTFVIGGHLNILEGYSLLPFVFLFIYIALKSKDWIFYSILAGILFALQILAGSIIMFFYTALITAFYFLFNLISKNFLNKLIRSLFVGIILIIVALSLAAIKLLPVLEFTEMSSRAQNVSFAEYLGHPVNLNDAARILITDLGYSGTSAAIGLAAIIFLLFSLLQYRKKIVVFSLILIIFSILFASNTFITNAMYKVPGFDKQRHVERSLLLFVFAGSILAGYGFVLSSEKLRKYRIYLKYEKILFAAVIFVILLELLFLHVAPLPSKIIQPKDIEILSYISNDKSIFRTMNIAQKDIIGAAGYNYYAQEKISEAKGGGGIWVNDYVLFLSIAQQTLLEQKNPKLLSVLNVKYIVSDQRIEANNLTLVNRFKACKDCAVWNAFGPYLYKNDYFIPRYYAAPKSILVLGDDEAVKKVIYSLILQNLELKNAVLVQGTKINDYEIDFLDKFDIIFLLEGSVDENSIRKLQEYASRGGAIVPNILNGQNTVTNEDIDIILNQTGNFAEIKIEEYSNKKVVLNLNGEKGWLVASERFAHFPGWKASIDGKPIELLKSNNAITAVYLNGEVGKLVFEYKPELYSRGKLISLMGFFAVVVYLGYYMFKVYFKNKNKIESFK